MKIPSAKEKDFVLNLYYNRDVKGIAPPREGDCPHNFREIEAILNDDGYIVSNNGYLVISTKGRAFLGKGGYTASYLSGVLSTIVAWLLSQCSNLFDHNGLS